nr:dihydrofolate reductase family protein [Kineococcus vitellinus]
MPPRATATTPGTSTRRSASCARRASVSTGPACPRNRVDRPARAAHDGPVSTRELVYFVAVSLDGFIAAPDGGYGDFTAEPELLHEFTDAFPSHVQRLAGVRVDRSRFDTVVMGWNTCTPALDEGIESPYAHLRQYVVASPGRRVGADVHLVHDAVATVRALKAEPSGTAIHLAGGGRLAGSLLDEIDRLVLKVSPVVLGDGVPLFGRAGYSPRPLRVLEQRRFGSGLTLVEAVPRR